MDTSTAPRIAQFPGLGLALLLAMIQMLLGCHQNIKLQGEQIDEAQKASIIEDNLGFKSAISDLNLVPPGGKISVNATISLYALAQLDDKSTVNVSSNISLSVDDPSIIALETASANRFQTLKKGTAVIEATVSDVKKTATFEVVDPNDMRLEMIGAVTRGPVGTHLQFNALTIFDNFHVTDVTKTASWTSSNPDVASFSITSHGVLLLNKPGKTDILVRDSNGLLCQRTVEVTEAILQKLSSTPERISQPIGGQQAIQIFAHYSDGQIIDITNQVVMQLQNSEIATIIGTANIEIIGKGYDHLTASFEGKTLTIDVIGSEAELNSLSISTAKHINSTRAKSYVHSNRSLFRWHLIGFDVTRRMECLRRFDSHTCQSWHVYHYCFWPNRYNSEFQRKVGDSKNHCRRQSCNEYQSLFECVDQFHCPRQYSAIKGNRNFQRWKYRRHYEYCLLDFSRKQRRSIRVANRKSWTSHRQSNWHDTIASVGDRRRDCCIIR